MGENPRPTPGTPRKRHRASRVPSDAAQLEAVLRQAGIGGDVETTSHFKMRAAQRGFTAPEALVVLKRGTILGSPVFCAEFCNWKFEVEGESDNGELVIVAAVSAGDLGQSCAGSVMLITGFMR
jgi:hypothetical protein